MNELAEVLKRFNRKERNLLIRAILGDEEKPLLLSDEFIKKVETALGIEIKEKENAWWATDYHINWLAGALAYYTEGNVCLEKKSRPNRPSHDLSSKGKRMIEQNLEDVDLVIASGLDLILIEAKAYDSKGYARFTSKQLTSKRERFGLLHDEYMDIAARPEQTKKQMVRMHVLLMSPKKGNINDNQWPEWARKDGKIPWIEWKPPKGKPVLDVNQCNACGNRQVDRDHWRVVEFGSSRFRRENRSSAGHCA